MYDTDYVTICSLLTNCNVTTKLVFVFESRFAIARKAFDLIDEAREKNIFIYVNQQFYFHEIIAIIDWVRNTRIRNLYLNYNKDEFRNELVSYDYTSVVNFMKDHLYLLDVAVIYTKEVNREKIQLKYNGQLVCRFTTGPK